MIGVDYKICCQYCFYADMPFLDESYCDYTDKENNRCKKFEPWSVRQQINSKRKRYEKKLRKLTKQYY